MTTTAKPILEILQRRRPERVPFWLMRQAGRYLPEYLSLRAAKGSFLNLVYDPEAAAEITVQPLRRFGMDAAILFSDILIVPHALGQALTFEAGEGPRLEALTGERDFARLDPSRIDDHCAPIYETVARTRTKLANEGFDQTALIGFCGSPWTVICYMIEGRGSRDFESARRWALNDPASFSRLVDIVIEASCRYLSGQIKAGAEVVQLFESWGGILDRAEFDRWVIAPSARIVRYLKENHPGVPVIGFPRGAGVMCKSYALETCVDCIGLDPTIDPAWAAAELKPIVSVQGNLDPVRLLTGGKALEDGMAAIHENFGDEGWIFNLGHGVIKETNIDNVERLASIVRGWGR